ncbi:MAG: Wzz/FepE/Etk N-terminal domain-containing protein, partial [Plesiomonas sp.]
MNTQITQNPNTYQSDVRFPQVHDDEIDLRELFAVIWQGKWLIIAITAVFAIGAAV